jgi:sugar phosphate isomerase/epimerase
MERRGNAAGAESKKLNRRAFVKGTLAAGLAAGVVRPLHRRAAAEEEARGPGSVRLGGPIFGAPGSGDPDEIALAHKKVGYRAAYCPDVKLEDKARIAALRKAFEKHDVVIAEVGRWVNLLDSDPEKQKANLKLVADGLALAEEIGALCCVDIAGSYSKEQWFGPHPDNLSEKFFDEAVENARKIIDGVKPKKAKFCYEMMGWAIPDCPDSYLKLIKAVDREAFGVHLDPCNLVNSPARFYRNADLLRECFDKLGPWIASCHAKDLTWDVEMNVHFREVRPGAGAMDYVTFLERLAAIPHRPPLMIEHLASAEEYDKARLHIMDVGKKLGIQF